MRPAGLALAALLVGAVAVRAQQPAADPKLDPHLAAWEKTLTNLVNFKFALEMKKTDSLKNEQNFTGEVLCMKPNYAVLRLNNAADKTGADYEAVICDGKAVYQYVGLEKTVTRWPLPDPKAGGGATDNLMVDLISGMKVSDVKARFQITLYKEDENYVYLNVLPVLAKDKQEFQQLRMALYGPKTKFAYLPAMVYMVKPNGDIEQWKFKEPMTNIPNLAPKDFAYQKIPNWTEREGQVGNAQPAPGRPGQPMPPAVPPAVPSGARPKQ